MSYLLYLDESGHDHKNTPYEVHGGIAVHASRVWPLVSAVKDLEQVCFGASLASYGTEIKGAKILKKDRFKWAAQGEELADQERRRLAVSFLERGRRGEPARRHEFTAFGQACLKFAADSMQLLRNHQVALFAAMVPAGATRPAGWRPAEFLRKDMVFLLERYFYFLESKNEHGLIVMDETDKAEDRRLVEGMQRYFTSTSNGRYRTSRVVPAPLFVASDMSYLVQLADICIYCVNWGFRLTNTGLVAPMRDEIGSEYGTWLNRLQFQGDGCRDGNVFQSYGIFFVENPYG